MGCKNACDYCPQRLLVRQNKKRGGLYMMTRETFETCLDKVPTDVAIHFSGYCEPWQNSDCTAFVEYAANKGHEVSVFTTLYGVSEDDIIRLSRVSMKELTIHLPNARASMNIDVNDEYLGILALFERTSFRYEKRSYVFFGEPHPEVLQVIGRGRLHRLTSRAGNVDLSVKTSPSRVDGPIMCVKSREFQNVLLPNGDVALCCMDYGLQHVIGNLLRNSYEVLHRSPAFMRVLQGMSGQDGDVLCRTCEWAARVRENQLIDRQDEVVLQEAGEPTQAGPA